MRVKYDAATKKWFRKNMDKQTTVIQCERCGLFYRSLLDHRCKDSNKAERKELKGE